MGEEMTEKMYKARVEMSFIVEFMVKATHEDEAAAMAEKSCNIDAREIESLLYDLNDIDYEIPNSGIRCIEVKEYAGKNE